MKILLPRWLAFGLTSLLLASYAQADGSSTIPYEESFESFSNDYSILYDDTVEGLPPRNNGWWLGTSNDIANVSNHTFLYDAPGYPYVAGTQTNTLYFETASGSKGISNLFPTFSSNMFIEMMLRPGRMDAEESPLVKEVTNNCHLAMYVDTNGFLTVYHTMLIEDKVVKDPEYNEEFEEWIPGSTNYYYVYQPQWTTLVHTPIESNDWVRVLVELCVEAGLPRFQIRINNGTPMTDTNAYHIVGQYLAQSPMQPYGTWFISSLTSLHTFSGIALGGMGMIDDLRVQPGVPMNALTFGITPTVDAPGQITPSNKVYLLQGKATNVVITAPLYYYIYDITTNGATIGGSFGYGITNREHSIPDLQSDISIDGDVRPELAASNTPKWWLASHNLLDFDNDATNDIDGDGCPTWREFELGSDPTNALSIRFLITQSAGPNGNISPSTNLYVWGFRTDTPVFTVAADPTYLIEDILTNGFSIGGTFGIDYTNYIWTNVASTGSIHAVFAPAFGPPNNVTASDGTYTDKVFVVWDLNNQDATNYMVYRYTDNDFELADIIGETETNYFADFGTSPGIPYYYWVVASNEFFISSPSDPDTGWQSFLFAPTNLSASDGAYTGKVDLLWAPAAGADGYEVWRNTEDVSSNALCIATNILTTNYADQAATAANTYYYWVKGTNALGTSGFSDPDTGWQKLIPPPNVAASDGTLANTLRVSWDSVPGAIEYEVWRNGSATTNGGVSKGVQTSPFDDLDTVHGGLYYYWIVAKSALGDSEPSLLDSGYQGLNALASLAASGGTYTNKIELGWDTVSGATGYEIRRNSIDDSGSSEIIGDTILDSFEDGVPAPGSNLYYWVRATNAVAETVLSASVSGWVSLTEPAGLSASDGSFTDKVELTWTALQGATGYEIYRDTSNVSVSADRLGSSASTAYSDLTTVPGTLYYYWLKATNILDISEFSAMDTGWQKMSPPTDVAASDGTFSDKIQISWVAAPGATHYAISRNLADNSGTATEIGLASGTSYDDSTVGLGTNYYYWIKASNTLGLSDYSLSDVGTLGLPAPTAVSATDGTFTNKIAISWGTSAGAAGYEVWQNTSNDTSNATRIVQTEGTTADDLTVTEGVQYWYWVRSTNGSATSDYSTPDTGFRGIDVAANVTATDGDFTNKIQVAWDAVTGAEGYQIWRHTTNALGSASQLGSSVGTTYDDATADDGVLYYYWIRATNSLYDVASFSAANSGYRSLSIQLGLTATDGDFTNKVALSWLTIPGATGYQVWRNLSNDTGTATTLGAPTVGTSADDLTAVTGIEYWYWVQSTNAIATSGYGPPDTGWVNLMAPAWVTASDDAFTDKVEVVWAPAFSALGYEVWRNVTNLTNSATVLGESASTNYDDVTAGFGTNYYYWIKATNALGISEFSVFDIGTRKNPVVYVLLKPTVDAYGTITPNTNIWVAQGSTTNFLVVASNYYHVAGVTTDGVAVVDVFGGSSYNFIYTNIMVDGTGTVHGQIALSVTTNSSIPYYWLAGHGLTNGGATFEQAVVQDTDDDGMSAGDEFIAGTDPTNRMSTFRIVHRGLLQGSNVVKWLGGTSGGVMTNPYSVLVRTNLQNGAVVATGTVERANGTNTWMYQTPTNSKVFFYRIKATD